MPATPNKRLPRPVLPDGRPIKVPAAFAVVGVETGAWRLERPVVDLTRCNRCGICERYCPLQVITESRTTVPRIDLTYCKGCGVCANECPRVAIAMVAESEE